MIISYITNKDWTVFTEVQKVVVRDDGNICFYTFIGGQYKERYTNFDRSWAKEEVVTHIHSDLWESRGSVLDISHFQKPKQTDEELTYG